MTRARVPLEALAACSPVDPGPDPDLDRALALIGSDFGSGLVRRAAVGTATVAAVAAVVAVAWVGSLAACAVLAAGSLAGYGLYGLPAWFAAARRTRALGDVPDLVGLAALRARVSPTPEGTAAFAAEHGRDPLAASLHEHVRRARGTPRAGWEGFADTWGEWDPSLRRAISLLGAAVDAESAERKRLLDRALAAVLDGTRDRTAEFAAAIRGPTSAIYAFGVVLPLALVAGLPAARSAGVPVSVAALVAVYDVLLPLALLAACAWVLARRPAAFPPAAVPRDHPSVPDRRAATVACAVGLAVAAWIGARRLGPAWIAWITAPGTGVGGALVWWFDPVRRVRTRVTRVEAGLPNALALAGQRLQRGESVEAAVAAAGRNLSGPAGDVFADAARVQRQLRVGPRDAFLGEAGALAEVPSPRARASAALLALASREGAHGGRVLVEMAGHVEDLLEVERDARKDLAHVVGTLRSTAYCFGPLVGGVTVALGTRLGEIGLERTHAPFPASSLGLAVGVYVLALAVILAALAAALDRGLDRAVVGFHVGAALVAASVVYALSVAGAGLLV